jgi:hypothetical protein
VIATGVFIFFASSAARYWNIGARADFLHRWLSALIIAWPVAAATKRACHGVSRFSPQKSVGHIRNRSPIGNCFQLSTISKKIPADTLASYSNFLHCKMNFFRPRAFSVSFILPQ